MSAVSSANLGSILIVASCACSPFGMCMVGQKSKAIFQCRFTKNVTAVGSPKTWLNYRRYPTTSWHKFTTASAARRFVTTKLPKHDIFTKQNLGTRQKKNGRAVSSAFGAGFSTAADTQTASAAGMDECGWSAANYFAVLASLWP